MYKDDSIEKFLEKLSSSDSVPGGGVAASLLAAIGISCALKVCNLSLGKEKYKEHEELISNTIMELEKYKNEFFNLMDEDAEKFKAMEEVYKMPKNTEEEKKERKAALENACKTCCEAPRKALIKIAEISNKVLPLIGITNKSAESDLKISIEFLREALIAEWKNIEINLKYIEEEEFKKEFDILKNITDQIEKSRVVFKD